MPPNGEYALDKIYVHSSCLFMCKVALEFYAWDALMLWMLIVYFQDILLLISLYLLDRSEYCFKWFDPNLAFVHLIHHTE